MAPVTPELIEDSINLTVVKYGEKGICTDQFLNFVDPTQRVKTYFTCIAERFRVAGPQWDPLGTPIFLLLPNKAACPLCGHMVVDLGAWENGFPEKRHCIRCFSLWRPQYEDTQRTLDIAFAHPTLGLDIFSASRSFYEANLQSYIFMLT